MAGSFVRVALATVLLSLPALAMAAEWRVTTETSGLDGRKSARAMLDSDAMLPNVIGVPEPAVLVISCAPGRLEAYVAWPNMVGTRSIRGGYRVDDLPPVMNEGFSSSSDGTGTFFYRGRINQTLAAIVSGRRLVVRAEPSGYLPQEATWTLGDVRAAFSKVVEGC